MEKNKTVVKIVVVGDAKVGKTALILNYLNRGTEVPESYEPTIVDERICHLKYNGTEDVELHIWDTTGDEDFDRIRPLCYTKTDIFLVCADVMSHGSFEDTKTKWYPETAHFVPEKPKFLIGTKALDREDKDKLASLGQGWTPVSYEYGLTHAKDMVLVCRFGFFMLIIF